jgi:hypothetical protein
MPPKIEKYLLNLAGEYRICSELCKRGVFATVTYGHRKGVDVYVISDVLDRALKIEVKTSQSKTFVTGITQKGLVDSPTAPDFWVLFHLVASGWSVFAERFFVLSHREICDIQDQINASYAEKYALKHGTMPDLSKGVDNVTLTAVAQHEDRWDKIITRLQRAR